MKNWQDDKRWSDRFIPEIKSILGLYLIGEPPLEEDAEHNTDLMVLKMDAVRIACRIRKHSYLANYGDEFTIRTYRPSGQKTELAKIIEGWGNYMFYGFSDIDQNCLSKWCLLDLNVFRLWLMRYMALNKGKLPSKEQNNVDNSSRFMAFQISNAPDEIVVAESSVLMKKIANERTQKMQWEGK